MINKVHLYWLCSISPDGTGACAYRPDNSGPFSQSEETENLIQEFNTSRGQLIQSIKKNPDSNP
jgi:hypothetical protein